MPHAPPPLMAPGSFAAWQLTGARGSERGVLPICGKEDKVPTVICPAERCSTVTAKRCSAVTVDTGAPVQWSRVPAATASRFLQ
jgi:hypothetical protein